ncbi:MAG TPA: nuclear transport factor 2 family protein [Solirubrobacteraceae bacterium]|nr:nuclear transport factor 2 family protein [Solirubrobacteraceae bacterium]
MTSPDALVERFLAAWSGADIGTELAATCAPDLHYEDPLTLKGPLHGPGALTEHVARLRAAAPDARLERAGEPLTDGRFVAVPVRLLGTHTAEIESFPPTGREVSVHGVFYCELDEARTRLWRVRAFFDLYDAAIQLGVLPQPGSAGQRALMLLRGFGLRAGM